MDILNWLSIWQAENFTSSKHPSRRKATGTSSGDTTFARGIHVSMIRKLKSGEYRLYSRKKDQSTGKRRNLGTFSSLEKAKKHEQEIQYFKKH